MEISLTKLSPNGQVVIPSQIRRDANLKPSTKFIVFNQGGNILLKKITPENLQRDMELMHKIQASEAQIKSGKVTKVNSQMSAKDIDDILMG